VRIWIPLGPGYWIRSLTAVNARGVVRRLRDGRLDIWNLFPPLARRAYVRGHRG
jgi:hypothetical protein